MKKKTQGHVSPVLVPPIPEKAVKDSFIVVRVPDKLRRNVEKRLDQLGVPKRHRSDFYRGAILAGVGNALRARDPEWQAFVKAIQPLAQRHLGMAMTDDGVAGLLDEGAMLSGRLAA